MKNDISKTMILSDIDGTFLNSEGKLVEANLEAIKRYMAAGGHFAFATGRVEAQLPEVIPMWKELVNIPTVVSNGAYLNDVKTDSVVHSLPIDRDLIMPIVHDLRKRYPSLKIYITLYHCIRYTTDDLDAGKPIDSDINKVVVKGSKELVDEVRDYVYSLCGDKLAYSKSWDIYLEFLNPLATKGTQLDWLREYLGGDVTAYAIGDFDNDADMLRHADVPVCPSNGYGPIVEYCQNHERGFVVCSNNDGAIAALIDRIMNEQ